MDTKKHDVVIRTSYDELEAYLMLPVIRFEERYTKEEIMDALSAKRVTVGLDHEFIDKMISDRLYGREYLIAKGEAAEDGKDGYYEFHFDTNLNNRPLAREDGSVDYWTIHAVEIVEEGQVIAIYHEPILGKNGMTVTGKPINAKRGRPQPPLTGKGFDRSEDNLVYTANMTGKIDKRDNRIMISEVYEIYGNVDMNTGNINFRGDVLIHGNVTAGMTVIATGSITVDGTVEACTMEAGKDIILRGGVLGAYRTQIKSKMNIYAKFIEYATIEAEGIIDANSVLDCNVTSYDRVFINGRKASIVGGTVYGAKGVETDRCGNDKEIKTRVEAGVHRGLLKKLYDVQEQITEDSAIIEKINAGLQQFDELAKEKNIDVKNDERRIALMRAKIMKQAQLATSNDKMRQLNDIMERAKGAKIRIIRDIYPGSTIAIDDIVIQVKEPQQCVEFEVNADKVLMFSIRDEFV